MSMQSKMGMFTAAVNGWPQNKQQLITAYEAYLRNQKAEPLRSTEPRIGWRVWKLAHSANATGRVLVSAAYSQHAWPHRKPMKRDKIDNRGIHAMKDPQHVKALVRDYNAEVAGSVWMWGEVKEYTQGYLAEFAYPRTLFMAEDTDPLVVLELEEAYGVPITLRDLGWQQDPASRSTQAYMQQLAALQGILSGLSQATAPPNYVVTNATSTTFPYSQYFAGQPIPAAKFTSVGGIPADQLGQPLIITNGWGGFINGT